MGECVRAVAAAERALTKNHMLAQLLASQPALQQDRSLSDNKKEQLRTFLKQLRHDKGIMQKRINETKRPNFQHMPQALVIMRVHVQQVMQHRYWVLRYAGEITAACPTTT